MAGDILIIKSKGQKKYLKITRKMRAGYSPSNHTIVINLDDFRDVALFLHDLKDLYNVPVEKAIAEFESGRSKTWPF